MMFDLITIVLVGVVLMFAVYTAMQLLGKFPRRTLDDVTPYLRPAELEEIQDLLDPAQEVNFRLRLSPDEFRRWQRKRIHLMREYLLRMSHNALVLIEWGNLECFEGGSGPGSHRNGRPWRRNWFRLPRNSACIPCWRC